MAAKFKKHNLVKKTTGDYLFEGYVIAVMEKIAIHSFGVRHGFSETDKIRYAVQNPQGLIHIFSENQLEAY